VKANRWQRPMFGPFRRQAHTGVPADHFRPAAEMTAYGDGVTVLVADGPAGAVLDQPTTAEGVALLELAATDPLGVVAQLNGMRGLDVAAQPWAPDREAIYAAVAAADPSVPALAPLNVIGHRVGVWARVAEWADISDAAESLLVQIDADIDELLEELGITDDDQATAAAVKLSNRAKLVFGRMFGEGALAAAHPAFTGKHSHSHASMGSQGSDATHSHSHSHNGDAKHGHAHGTAYEGPVGGLSSLTEAKRREFDGANEITDPVALAALVASALERRGITAATSANGTVIPAAFHAYLCAEGIRTDDGRELVLGSCRYPDLPISLRLLIEDEGGHWGAVTCGRIDTIEPMDVNGLRMHYAEGVFGSDPNGQLAELMVREQTQRFVSIDPRDVTATLVEVEISRSSPGYFPMFDEDGDGGEYDCWLQITDCVIGAATIVPMPALPQAVIALADVELPEAPIANESAPPGLGDRAITASTAPAASGIPVTPPAAWFQNPGFHVGDPRLVKQPDGHYAAPLTITEDGQVYGHFCYWGAKHTGFPGRTVNPPKSKTGYAHYLTGACPCDGGDDCGHAVGQVTMGCGHAPLTKKVNGREVPLAAHEVQAHYDGGYGAVQMADITTGEDDFGGWFAGALKPGVTAEQIRDFRAMGVSGDWRELASPSGGLALDLLAILSVPAPGFPIARRALTAAGAQAQDAGVQAMRAGYHDERMFALVAAGVVRPVDPIERMAQLEQEVIELHRLIRPIALAHARDLAGI